MKIIAVDDQGRETVADVLVAEYVHESFGHILVDFLNSRGSCYDPYNLFFKLVEDDHKLWRGMEELV